MALIFKHGNMFAEPVEAIVNTVNCAGVMGKGVALEFKKRWPENFKQYKKLCDDKKIVPGSLFIYDNHDLIRQDGPRYLVNFPTKKHWRSKSKISYIEDGLDALTKALKDYQIDSIAMPALGCGNGGLDWSEVKVIIKSKLADIGDIEVIVFEGASEREVPEYKNQAELPMTFERAITLKALGDLETHFDGAYDRVSMQKIVYFLQSLGVKYNLDFSRNLYGPYSLALKKAFLAFEQHQLISGFSGTERMSSVTTGGYAQSDEFLVNADTYRADEIVNKLDMLIQGYESPYGMELLSSVHWLSEHENKNSLDDIASSIAEWSDSKKDRFSKDAINGAYNRLVTDNLISKPLN